MDEIWGADETCLIFVVSLGNWNSNLGSCGWIVVRRSPGDKYVILSNYQEFFIHFCSTITPLRSCIRGNSSSTEIRSR